MEIGGLGFILSLYYSSRSNVFDTFWIEKIGQTGNLFLLVIVAYIIGRILIEIAVVTFSLYYFFVGEKLNTNRLKEALSSLFLHHKRVTYFTAREVEKEISIVDQVTHMQENPSVSNYCERLVFAGLFQRLIFIASLIFTFLIAWQFVIPAFIFFLLALKNERELSELMIGISKKIHYEKTEASIGRKIA